MQAEFRQFKFNFCTDCRREIYPVLSLSIQNIQICLWDRIGFGGRKILITCTQTPTQISRDTRKYKYKYKYKNKYKYKYKYKHTRTDNITKK